MTYVCCPYCAGWFVPSRSDAVTCSDACRQARCRALRPDYEPITPADDRRNKDVFSEARRSSTGWGNMTPSEMYAADVRVRTLAGLEPFAIPRYLEFVDSVEFKRSYHEDRLRRLAASEGVDATERVRD